GAGAHHLMPPESRRRHWGRRKAMAALVERPQSAIPSPAPSGAQAAPLSTSDNSFRPGAALLRRLLPALQTALAMLAALGAGIFVASLLVGRSAFFWPSARWLLVCAASLAVVFGLWWLASVAATGNFWQRWQAASWPPLALLPAALAAIALY